MKNNTSDFCEFFVKVTFLSGLQGFKDSTISVTEFQTVIKDVLLYHKEMTKYSRQTLGVLSNRESTESDQDKDRVEEEHLSKSDLEKKLHQQYKLNFSKMSKLVNYRTGLELPEEVRSQLGVVWDLVTLDIFNHNVKS